jgi:hypothetical protein
MKNPQAVTAEFQHFSAVSSENNLMVAPYNPGQLKLTRINSKKTGSRNPMPLKIRLPL